MKKFLLILFVFYLFPLVVFAGSNDEDITYTIDYDENYDYGNVSKCTTSSGTAWFEGIKTINGVKVCLWNTEEAVGTNKFQCEDTSMEKFELGEVTGNDGKTYYGYGCRKPKDLNNVEYIKKQINVGYSEYIIDPNEDLSKYNRVECSIISGSEYGSLSIVLGDEICKIDAIKSGTVKVKVFDPNNAETIYYEYEIVEPSTLITELDSNYIYGNVDACTHIILGNNVLDKVQYDGYTFCGSTLPGYNFELGTVSCISNDFETFPLTFQSSGQTYKGFGCRKCNDASCLSSGDLNNNSNNIVLGTPLDCDTFKGTETYEKIKTVFKWIQIAAPIMLIIFGIMDFGQAVISGDNDAMKKAQSKFIKRVIITAVIILLPIIMDLFVTLLDGALGNDVCNIGE